MPRDEQRTIVDGIDFDRVLRFPSIIGAIASSMQPSRLIVGLFMVAVLLASGQVWDTLAGATVGPGGLFAGSYEGVGDEDRMLIAESAIAFADAADPASDQWTPREAQQSLAADWNALVRAGEATEDDAETYARLWSELGDIAPVGVFEAAAGVIGSAFLDVVAAASHLDIAAAGRGLARITWELPQALWSGGYHWFISVYGFLLVLVLGIGGGALARMQACQHARGDRLSAAEAVALSCGHWREIVLAIIAPAMVIAALAIVLVLMGLLLMNIPGLNLIGGLLYGLALVIGFLAAVLAVGYAGCWPMLVPAVVIEHCDGGEAVQRSYAYLVARPLHMLGYIAVAVVGLVLGFLVVRLVATTTLDLTADLVGTWTFNDAMRGAGAAAAGDPPMAGLPWYEASTAGLIDLWELLVRDLILGWIFSGFYAVSAMIYLLMRRACDAQDTREIWWPGLVPGTLVPEEHA